MSAETKAAIEQALQAHILDESGDDRMLTEYVITAAYVDLSRPAEEQVTGYQYLGRGSYHSALGLAYQQVSYLRTSVFGDTEP